MEKYFIVELRRQFGAAPVFGRQGAPVAGIQGAPDKLALNVTFQEAGLVDVEQFVAVQAKASAVKLPPDTPATRPTSSSMRILLPLGETASMRRRASSTPYENAAARVPRPKRRG